MNQRIRTTSLFIPVLATVLSGTVRAQIANPTAIAPGVRSVDVIQDDADGFSIYRIQPVQRTLTAVNYFVNDGPSGLKFAGTDLAHQITGKARVEARTGRTDLSIKLDHLSPATGFGPEYLTYVLWAISADGRAQNLGELEVHGSKADTKVSSSFQSFGMIVTAEPYYSVSQPSDVVVAQSVPDKHTNGVLQQVNTHYSLLPRGLYANTSGAQSVPNATKDLNGNVLAMLEAQNAERVALAAGAGQFSPDIAGEVAQDLITARNPPNGKKADDKLSLVFARQATQRAEDARISALHKESALRLRDAMRLALDAQAQADAARAAQAQSDSQRDQALSAAAQAQAAADAARQSAAVNQAAAAALRARLRKQLNAVLETRETARGLIVNVSGVLFDTGKSTLKPRAKLSLTKVATILSLYPSLKLQAEGYTDSTGGVELNQSLSEQRAKAVSEFLISNGVSSSSLTSKGFGESDPVATNATAAGRSKNRRVSLVVSGSAIGVDSTQRP